ncbi:MAG: DNA repair protein RadA [Armatimonadia bacterium]|nr:DNA repair protein RadA [Armatimonadia bacterium]
MAKTRYVCDSCGHDTAKWYGQCPSCGEWNSMGEISLAEDKGRAPARTGAGAAAPLPLAAVNRDERPRLVSGIDELDRVLGGGLVPGAAVLVAGDPGVGKSTLMLQAAHELSAQGSPVLYVTGEESAKQIRLRADRLSLPGDAILVLAETVVDGLGKLIAEHRPGCIMVDSVQAVRLSGVDGTPGSIAQVRAVSDFLIGLAKTTDLPLIVAGHVTKEGAAAGPRALEHLVDAVLYFEGERAQQLRVLRAQKNRFGSVDEIGLFEMGDGGLREVSDPTGALLGDPARPQSGCAVSAALSGTRPLLVQIEALVAPASYGTGRRVSVGIDNARAALVLAVLERRAGVVLGSADVFLGVSGGLKLTEPGSDLALALAVASSAEDRALAPRTVAIGEIGLSGELRPVSGMRRRVQEAVRLGFETIVGPLGDEATLAPKPRVARTLEEAMDAAL